MVLQWHFWEEIMLTSGYLNFWCVAASLYDLGGPVKSDQKSGGKAERAGAQRRCGRRPVPGDNRKGGFDGCGIDRRVRNAGWQSAALEGVLGCSDFQGAGMLARSRAEAEHGRGGTGGWTRREMTSGGAFVTLGLWGGSPPHRPRGLNVPEGHAAASLIAQARGQAGWSAMGR